MSSSSNKNRAFFRSESLCERVRFLFSSIVLGLARCDAQDLSSIHAGNDQYRYDRHKGSRYNYFQGALLFVSVVGWILWVYFYIKHICQEMLENGTITPKKLTVYIMYRIYQGDSKGMFNMLWSTSVVKITTYYQNPAIAIKQNILSHTNASVSSYDVVNREGDCAVIVE